MVTHRFKFHLRGRYQKILLSLLAFILGLNEYHIHAKRHSPTTLRKITSGQIRNLGVVSMTLATLLANRDSVEATESLYAPPKLGMNEEGSFNLCTGNSCTSSQVRSSLQYLLTCILPLQRCYTLLRHSMRISIEPY